MAFFSDGYLFGISNLLMYFLSLITFIIGLKFRKKHKEISHLYIYSLASFLQTTISNSFYVREFSGIEISYNMTELSISIFIIIEFSCIYFFFLKSKIINGLAKTGLYFLFVAFVAYYIFELFTVKNFVYSIKGFYFFDSCLIVIPCFIYIFKLFVNPPTLNLLNEPSFWFNSGVLIFLTLTLPFFFVIKYFISDHGTLSLTIVNSLGYCLVFSFLIRAYLCKRQTTI